MADLRRLPSPPAAGCPSAAVRLAAVARPAAAGRPAPERARSPRAGGDRRREAAVAERQVRSAGSRPTGWQVRTVWIGSWHPRWQRGGLGRRLGFQLDDGRRIVVGPALLETFVGFENQVGRY